MDIYSLYIYQAQQQIEHREWMRKNDPNTWAWLMPRDKRIALASLARTSANVIRHEEFEKKWYPLCTRRDGYNWFMQALDRFEPLGTKSGYEE
jgi:hypothetical protein